jgi:hypothetical protein
MQFATKALRHEKDLILCDLVPLWQFFLSGFTEFF